MVNCKSNYYDEISPKSEISESFYSGIEKEIVKYEMEIEEDKYSLNKPRRITIKAKVINDWSSKDNQW